MNAWLLDRCVAYAKARPHPERSEQTVWEAFELAPWRSPPVRSARNTASRPLPGHRRRTPPSHRSTRPVPRNGPSPSSPSLRRPGIGACNRQFAPAATVVSSHFEPSGDASCPITPAVHGRRLPRGLVQPPSKRQTLPERDGMRFRSLGTSLPARCTKRPSDCGESAERSTMRRMLGDRFGCTLAAANSAIGGVSPCAWRIASREPTRSDRKRRRFGRRAVGRRSLGRASRYRPASLAAAAGRLSNARRSGRALHCKRRGIPASRSPNENVVARIEMVAGPQSGICLWHDPHHSPNPVAGNIESLRGLRDESCERKGGAGACRASYRSWHSARGAVEQRSGAQEDPRGANHKMDCRQARWATCAAPRRQPQAPHWRPNRGDALRADAVRLSRKEQVVSPMVPRSNCSRFA